MALNERAAPPSSPFLLPDAEASWSTGMARGATPAACPNAGSSTTSPCCRYSSRRMGKVNVGLADARGVLGDRVEHRLDLRRRTIGDTQDLSGRRLLLHGRLAARTGKVNQARSCVLSPYIEAS